MKLTKVVERDLYFRSFANKESFNDSYTPCAVVRVKVQLLPTAIKMVLGYE